MRCFTQNTIFKLILKISSSTWNFMQREYKINVDNGQYFRSKLYYRVYTLKHCEIILIHNIINSDTTYLIWCYGYNFYKIQWSISHYTGQPKCPRGNGSNSNYHKFSTANIIFTKRFKNFFKYYCRNAWRWCKIFQNSYFIPMTAC